MAHHRSGLPALILMTFGLAVVGCSSKAAVPEEGAPGLDGAAPGADASAADADAGAPGTDTGVLDMVNSDGVLVPPDAAPLPPGAHALTANDVSVLFSRAGASTGTVLWQPTLEGKGGPLLSLPTYLRIMRNLITGDGQQLYPPAVEYQKLRVVGVRFDPCFGATPCQAQVRLVLQAFTADGSVFDGGVHLLYNLTDQEFRVLLGELRALTALAPENRAGLPLGPSPALTAQGATGSYGTALRALVLRHAGEGNLARMTFMARTPSGNATWQFGGVNLKFFAPAGELAIAGTAANTLMQQVGRPTSVGEYAYTVTPAPVRLQPLLAVIDAQRAMTATPDARAAAYQALTSVENPTLESPDTADCASCHIANRLRGYLDEHYPPATQPATVYAGQAAATRFVGGAEKDDSNLRAFGHFTDTTGAVQSPAISQRTANETHRVLQMLATM